MRPLTDSRLCLRRPMLCLYCMYFFFLFFFYAHRGGEGGAGGRNQVWPEGDGEGDGEENLSH